VPTLLDPAGHIPAVLVLTEGTRRDLAVARGLHLPVDSIVTRDRGDSDDPFLFRWHQDGVSCVTRQQVNAPVDVTTRLAVARSTGVTADHEVVLPGPQGRAYPARLRPVHDRVAATGTRDVLWTKAVHWAATTSAASDQQRWPIALFFQAMQQNLRIKTFVGTSDHAVMTQVWAALITELSLAFLRFQAGLNISCQQMLRLLHINLFARRHLIGRCRRQPPEAVGSPLVRAV
jgi:hypothetical protein